MPPPPPALAWPGLPSGHHARAARPVARGAGLPDALLACAVLGLGVVAWLRLPALGAGEALAARQQQQADQAADNLAEALRALRASGFEPRVDLRRRVLLPAASARAPDCRAHDCAPAQLAEQLWQQWAEELARQLPGARAEIACRAANDDRSLTPVPPQASSTPAWQPAPDAVCELRVRMPGRAGAEWQWSLRA